MRKKMRLDVGVSLAPHDGIEKVMVNINKYPENEYEQRRAERFSGIIEVRIEPLRRRPKKQITETHPRRDEKPEF
jgi:hypothetical protein